MLIKGRHVDLALKSYHITIRIIQQRLMLQSDEYADSYADAADALDNARAEARAIISKFKKWCLTASYEQRYSEKMLPSRNNNNLVAAGGSCCHPMMIDPTNIECYIEWNQAAIVLFNLSLARCALDGDTPSEASWELLEQADQALQMSQLPRHRRLIIKSTILQKRVEIIRAWGLDVRECALLCRELLKNRN